MSEENITIHLTNLYDQAYILLQKIPEIEHMEDLVLLCCTTLNASLFINDAQGNVIVHSSFEDAPCPSWAERLKNGRIQNSRYTDHRNLHPMSNTLRHDKCSIDGCTRLYFPLLPENDLRPYVLNLFVWHTEVSPHEQNLAAIFAGAFSSLLKRQSLPAVTLHEKRIRILCELLDYKAGLKSYYLRALSQSGLQSFCAPFRLLSIPLSDMHQKNENLILLEIAHRLQGAWCFAQSGNLLVIFNEEQLSIKNLQETLSLHLAQQNMTACLSMPFYDLLRLRYMFEDCQSILPIAMKKEPDMRIHMAEHYQCTAFLSRCQQYFPLQDYYPEGLTQLIEYDQENNRNYLTTLTAYLENNLNANAAAKQIFMHRNTMMQQIEKIEQIMGLSLKDKEMCLYLQLCLRIRDLLEK